LFSSPDVLINQLQGFPEVSVTLSGYNMIPVQYCCYDYLVAVWLRIGGGFPDD